MEEDGKQMTITDTNVAIRRNTLVALSAFTLTRR